MIQNTNPHTTTAVLRGRRVDQMRTFLTVEAAADSARSAVDRRRTVRRGLAGVAVAGILGVGLVATASIAAHPGSGPVSVSPASALAIEDTGDGWVTVTINDRLASADQAVRQLEDAGLAATVLVDHVDGAPKGLMDLVVSAGEVDEAADHDLPDDADFDITGGVIDDGPQAPDAESMPPGTIAYSLDDDAPAAVDAFARKVDKDTYRFRTDKVTEITVIVNA